MNKNIHRPEAYLEPCQASKIELLTKIVRGFLQKQPLELFCKKRCS